MLGKVKWEMGGYWIKGDWSHAARKKCPVKNFLIKISFKKRNNCCAKISDNLK